MARQNNTWFFVKKKKIGQQMSSCQGTNVSNSCQFSACYYICVLSTQLCCSNSAFCFFLLTFIGKYAGYYFCQHGFGWHPTIARASCSLWQTFAKDPSNIWDVCLYIGFIGQGFGSHTGRRKVQILVCLKQTPLVLQIGRRCVAFTCCLHDG